MDILNNDKKKNHRIKVKSAYDAKNAAKVARNLARNQSRTQARQEALDNQPSETLIEPAFQLKNHRIKVKLAYDNNNAAKLTIKAAKHANTFHTIGNLY